MGPRCSFALASALPSGCGGRYALVDADAASPLQKCPQRVVLWQDLRWSVCAVVRQGRAPLRSGWVCCCAPVGARIATGCRPRLQEGSLSPYPQARSEGIVTEEVGDELVIFVAATQTAHALSEDAAAVWRHCDGRGSAEAIASRVGLDEVRVAQALEELSGAELLEEPDGISRREVYKRAAKLGAAALSAPLMYSVAIRPAAAAASVCTTNCPDGTVIPCGTGTGQCPARPGESGLTSICRGSTCYRGEFNNTCYCAGEDRATFEQTCSGDATALPCCAGQQFCVVFEGIGSCQQ